jgi:glycosyltransferase involved in cell wall biosynthesis
MEGLRAAGADVVEHHAEVWPDTAAKLAAAAGGAGLVRGGWRQTKAWWHLAARRVPRADVIVVGATAHADLPLAALAAGRQRVPLVFDPLVSASETIRDRGILPVGARTLRALGAGERLLFGLADRVIADTRAHGASFRRELGVAAEKIVVVPAGAPEAFRQALPPGTDAGRLDVAYFGQFIPLHGLEVVVAAASRLKDDPRIRFRLVGTGQLVQRIHDLVGEAGLQNVHFDRQWMTPSELVRRHVDVSDVCLGAFGDVEKTRRVVPFKVYAGLAAGRPVVTGDTPAVREMLVPGRDVVTVPLGDPAALASALVQLADRPRLRAAIGARAADTFARRFT